MKKLTIQEKAKAYDEAIEKARLVLQEKGNEPDGASILSELFPELIESEDERIRKAIIEIVKKDEERIGTNAHLKKIQWLKKQGEHKKFRDSIQVGDKVTRNEDGVLVNLSQLNRVAKKYEKQGEQNPVKEKFKHPLYVEGFEAGKQVGAQYESVFGKKQKTVEPTDLRTWKYIVDAVLTEREGIGQYLDSPFTEEVAKKLQKRFGNVEQKPVEWSEEDEKYMNALIDKLETLNFYNDSFSIGGYRVDIIANWLKSLRSQKLSNMERNGKNWKPSEEQIIALRWVLSKIPYNIHKEEISGLLDQIKDL